MPTATMPLLTNPWVRTFTPYLALFAAHLLTAQLAYYIYQGILPAIIWPAAGIAVAGLVLGGKHLWPSVATASLVNSILTAQPGYVAVAIAVGSTLQAYGCVYLLEYFKFDLMMNKLRDIMAFILIALGVSIIAPVIINLVLLAYGMIASEALFASIGRWWLAASTSIIIFGGFLIRWLTRPRFHRTRQEWAEIIVVIAIASGIMYLVAWTPVTDVAGVSLIYILLIPFFWLAFRLGPRTMTLAVLLVTLIMYTGVAWGYSGGTEPISDRIVSVQLFSLVWALIFFFLVVANEERKEALKAYSDHVDQLKDIIKRIRADEQVKTEFLAILAHELRNPLAPILSSIELLKFRGSQKSERERILESMEDRVAVMGRLLDDLLDISRVSRKKLQLQRETIDARIILERSIEMLRPIFEDKGHTLTVRKPEVPLYLHADPLRIEQIVVNLLTNAAKYTEPGGDIAVSLSRTEREMQLCVTDSGIGISENVIELIFEPFIQVPTGKNRSNSGLGIGLSLTKHLVELHKGSIRVKSGGAGLGSEFIVNIPVPETVTVPAALHSNNKKDAPAKWQRMPLKVLVVDDNEPAAEGLQKLLEHQGYETKVAFDGRSALSSAATWEPQAIILDIGLPDMTGYEVAQKLRETGYTSLLIALTGYGQIEDKIKAQSAGFDVHLTKPVGIRDLEQALQDAYGEMKEDDSAQGQMWKTATISPQKKYT